VSCTNPLDAGRLSDYWLGALTADEEAAVEEHFLGCDDCSSALNEVIALAAGLRKLAGDGSLTMIVSPEFLRGAAENGKRVREYRAASGETVHCTVTPEDDFLIGRLAADLRGASRIDLSLCDERGIEMLRLPDIPFDPPSGAVVWQQSITYSKAAPSGLIVARLLSVEEPASERLLGEYTFQHTRTMPGPPGW
jgi:putative zinc finger protein